MYSVPFLSHSTPNFHTYSTPHSHSVNNSLPCDPVYSEARTDYPNHTANHPVSSAHYHTANHYVSSAHYSNPANVVEPRLRTLPSTSEYAQTYDYQAPHFQSFTTAGQEALSTQHLTLVNPPLNGAGHTSSSTADAPLNLSTILERTGPWQALAASLPPLVPLKKSANVQTIYLCLTEDQRRSVDQFYHRCKNTRQNFDEDDPNDQKNALDKLTEMGLDRYSRGMVESRWQLRWSTSWGEGRKKKYRRIYQCSCGYDTKARQEMDKKVQRYPPEKEKEHWERRVPYPFTGCLAHVEFTEREDGAICSIDGHLAHNAGCQVAHLTKCPAIPVHPHVYEVALQQLKDGASLTAIKARNQEMVEKKLYRGLDGDQSQANFRYNLLTHDQCTLYRKHLAGLGVDARIPPQYNLDNWVNASIDRLSHESQRKVREAIFHYAARAEKGDRLKVCIATDEMDQAAFKYVHQSQLIVDGTFGVSSQRILLFICMGVDGDKKGLPVAFFLFSAPPGATATHANYNTQILTELFRAWRDHLIRKFGKFEPTTAITDTDHKERPALLHTWPNIILLICKFHLRQCWTNHRKREIKGSQTSIWKRVVCAKMDTLERNLIDSTDISAAHALIETERAYLSSLIAQDQGTTAARGGIAHLNYLVNYWMTPGLWKSWSNYGRTVAAAALKIPVQDVIPTTNHLESFNCFLKHRQIGSWMRSGRRLRFDVLIIILITEILPVVYRRHRIREEYVRWQKDRFRVAAGGKDITELERAFREEKEKQKQALNRICWWGLDEKRANAGKALMVEGAILSVVPDFKWQSFQGICRSSKGAGITYTVVIARNGTSCCTCPDFQSVGGACKHLRALRCVVDSLVSYYRHIPFSYPETKEEAVKLKAESPLKDVPSITPIEEPALTNWAALQELGQDKAVLGDDEDAREEEEAPVETDTDSDGDIEFAGGFSNSEQQDAINFQKAEVFNEDTKFVLPKLHRMLSILEELPSGPSNAEYQELNDVLRKITARMDVLGISTSHETHNPKVDVTATSRTPPPPPIDSSSQPTLSPPLPRIPVASLLESSSSQAPDVSDPTRRKRERERTTTAPSDPAPSQQIGGGRRKAGERPPRKLLAASPERKQTRKTSNGTT